MDPPNKSVYFLFIANLYSMVFDSVVFITTKSLEDLMTGFPPKFVMSYRIDISSSIYNS